MPSLRSRPFFCSLPLLATTALTLLAGTARAQDDVAKLQGQVVSQLRGVIAGYASKELPVDAAYERAIKLVEIDPQKISFTDKIDWELPARRNLADAEQLAVLADVEAWLRAALVNPSGKLPLSNGQVDALLKTSTLHLLPARLYGTPLDLDDRMMEVVYAYLETQRQRDRFSKREFSSIREYSDLGADDLLFMIEPGQIRCLVMLRQPYARRLEAELERIQRRQQDWQAASREMDRIGETYFARQRVNIQPLIDVLREALYVQSFPGLDQPLLNKEGASAVQIRLSASAGVPTQAGAAPGIREALPAAARGSSNRYVAGFRQTTPQTYSTVSLHNERTYRDDSDFGGPTQTSPPALVINQPGFLGGLINGLTFSPDGARLAVVGDALRIWNVNDGKLERTVRVVHSTRSSGLSDVAWSPNGRYVVVAVTGQKASLRIFDTSDFTYINDVLAGHDGFVDRLKFSPRGTLLATAGSDQRVYIWDWSTRQTLRAFKLGSRIDTLAFPEPASGDLLAIDTSGNAALVSASDVSIAPTNRSPVVQRLLSGLRLPDGGKAHPYVAAFDGAHRRLAVGGWSLVGGQYKYWCGIWVADKAEPERVISHDYYLTACAFSPGGDKLAAADGLGTIVVSDVASGAELQRFTGRGKAVYSVQPEGQDVLLLGRTPRDMSSWQQNWYGRLEQHFDLMQRSCLPLPTPRDPERATLGVGNLRLEHVGGDAARRKAPQLVVKRDSSVLSYLPLAEEAKWHALSFGFLRSGGLGINNPIVLGMESGELSCFDPSNFLTLRSFGGHTDRVWHAAESSNGQILFSASGDGTVRAWSLTQPRAWGGLAAYTDNGGRVTHVVPGTPTKAAGIKVNDRILSINGQSLEQLGADARRGEWPFKPGEVASVAVNEMFGEPKQVKLSNIGDLVAPLYSIFVSPDGRDWVIWTPQGYYDASPGADSWIGWEIDRGEFEPADFAPLSQFRQKFHRPDLIDQLIRTGQLPKGAEIPLLDDERRNQFGPPGGNRPQVNRESVESIITSPPRVHIIEPAAALHTGLPEVTLRAEVRLKTTDQTAFGKPDITILVNGHPAAVARSLRPLEETIVNQESVWTISQTVVLEPAENTISVVATNRVGHSDPGQATVKVVYRTQEQQRPLLDVLAIGVSKYRFAEEGKLSNLQYAADDATQFAATVEKTAAGLHRVVRVKTLVDEQATKEACLGALADLIKAEDYNRTVVIFLAAHGFLDQKTGYYLVTHDAKADDLFRTALPWSELQRTIMGLAGCRVLLFADTCHSAAVGAAVDPDRLHERALADEDKGVFVFAACGARQRSYELAALGHGLFTQAILETLTARGPSAPGARGRELSLWQFKGNVSANMRLLCDRFMLREPQDLWCKETGKDFSLFQLAEGSE